MADERSAVGGGRLSRTLMPAHLARRAALRWMSSQLTWGETRAQKRGEFVMKTARDVAETMGDMKGAIMKFGQILSLMSGVLPEDMTAELASLQRNAPPMAYNLVEDVFERDFGRPPEQIFRTFERMPFAAASIGQVHRATLLDGQDVAVKVQYPGVRKAIEHDLANVKLMVSLVGAMSPGIEPGPIVRDLKEGLLGELDYLREAASQERFAGHFRGHAFIRVPEVVHELTTPHVLVQEFIGGRPFATLYEADQATRDRIAEIVFRYSFGSIYRHRLFNGDPHPGNYILLDDGGVAFVDYGCVAEFTDAAIAGFVRVLRALLSGDLEEWRRGIVDMGILRADAPFTTDVLYEHMHWYWAPVLSDELTFTPELAREMVRRNTQTIGLGGRINQQCNVPEGMVYLTRINFGLSGLLGSLRASGPWRGIIEEYIDGREPCTELGRLSDATSRGRGV